jgi:hypothetical protein
VLLSLCVYVSHQLLTAAAAEFDACQAYACAWSVYAEATCADNINGPADNGPSGRSCQCPSYLRLIYDESRGCIDDGEWALRTVTQSRSLFAHRVFQVSLCSTAR